MAAKRDKRIASATFFASQVDFTHAGDLKVFADEEQIAAIERQMAERGYLDSRKMANAFNLLRSNDLIWPYVINNYFKGKEPLPFDLLYWNSDSTRMPAANHSFYLRNCYLENNLARGKMVIDGKTLDLSKVKIPIYNLATREDHIAPAKSVLLGSKFFGGPVRFVLAGFRPYRRRDQSAGQERSINTGPARSRSAPTSTSGSPRPRSIPAPGGRTGSNGSRASTRHREGAQAGRRDQADRGRAGELREGQGLKSRAVALRLRR